MPGICFMSQGIVNSALISGAFVDIDGIFCLIIDRRNHIKCRT